MKTQDLEQAKRLELPKTGVLPMVLDTDTNNEVDDQFALAYALASPERIQLQAVYAAPYFNRRSTGAADGMERSYNEILRLCEKLRKPYTGKILRGSAGFLPDDSTALNSPAVQDLITRAAGHTAENPLYVAAIGAITNVASALLLEPSVKDRIVVLWLGGHPVHWPNTREFNLKSDMAAARAVLNSGVPLFQMPCLGVASHLLTTREDLALHIAGKGPLCSALLELFTAYRANHFAYAKEIWDVAVIAWLVQPSWVLSELVPTPYLRPNGTWRPCASLRAGTPARPLMRSAKFIVRNKVFADMYRKIVTL